jgi:GNAT superfamily N-acetyltransferase
MTVNVRRAEPADRAACLSLIATLADQEAQPGWKTTYDALITGARGEVLVAVEDGRLLGVLTVSYNLAIRYAGEYCQIEELIVDPAARGKNIGALLVTTAANRARERGCAEIGLYLVEHTERNRPFYEKYGFHYAGSEMRQTL